MGALVIHSIPSGTSRDIRHLLMRLLKRNAKERMEFGKQGFRGTFVRILCNVGNRYQNKFPGSDFFVQIFINHSCNKMFGSGINLN